MRILISRLSALGDAACTLPVAGSLKLAFPEAEIVWLVDRRFSGVVECCKWVDQVVLAEKGLRNIKAQAEGLGEFDAALDMQGLLKSALPVFFAKAERKLAYHWQREGSGLLVGKVLPDPNSIHVIEQYTDVARVLGGSDAVDFGLVPKEEDVALGREVLREAGWGEGEPLVLANAGAGWAAKRWAPENFAAVVRAVEAEGGRMGFIGTEADRPAFAVVVEAGGEGAMDLLGKTKVRALVGLLSLADVVLAGDTGALHIAAGLGRPCVGVYTQTRPERSGAWGQIENCRDTDLETVRERVLGYLKAGRA